MSDSEPKPTEKPAEDFTRTWRYKVGLTMIIGGNLGILLGALLGFVGVGAATIGALVVGGEIVSLATVRCRPWPPAGGLMEVAMPKDSTRND